MFFIPRPVKFAVCLVIACLSVLIFSTFSHSLNLQDVPNPQQEYGGWVTDMADVISDQGEAELNQMISGLETTNGTEFAVVTVPETAPAASPKEFATELFNTWGIGKQGEDNGVLFLTSVGDRRVEIETGYGVERVLPNARVSKIIKGDVIPHFKEGNLEAGILAGTNTLVGALQGETFDGSKSILNYLMLPLFSLVAALFNFFLAKRVVKEAVFAAPTSSFKLPKWEEQGRRTLAFEIMSGLMTFCILFALIFLLWTLFAVTTSKTVGTGVALLIALIATIVTIPLNRVLIAKELFYLWRDLRPPVYCRDCQQKMRPLAADIVSPLLNPHQKKAQELVNFKFHGWHCPRCQPEMNSDSIHLRAYVPYQSKYSECPVGKDLTVTIESRILTPATYSHPGKRLNVHTCQCCDYHYEEEKTIPRKKQEMKNSPMTKPRNKNIYRSQSSSSSSSSYSSSNNSYSGDDYDSSSSSSSSSDYSSGGSFGGGESGGGGAGDDW